MIAIRIYLVKSLNFNFHKTSVKFKVVEVSFLFDAIKTSNISNVTIKIHVLQHVFIGSYYFDYFKYKLFKLSNLLRNIQTKSSNIRLLHCETNSYFCGKYFQVVYLTNKRKIINDPVYGFISIPGDFVFDLIEHPWFQRLRNIKQLGLTSFVYPGANHSRFQHGLGALHLMDMAISTLRSKGVVISDEEEEATCIAILLHDAGHGPFSHALENSIISGIIT